MKIRGREEQIEAGLEISDFLFQEPNWVTTQNNRLNETNIFGGHLKRLEYHTVTT